MPPKSSAGRKQNARRTSGNNKSQGASRTGGRQTAGTGQAGQVGRGQDGQDGQAVQGKAAQPQQPTHNPLASRNAQPENSFHYGMAAAPNNNSTGRQIPAMQRSVPAVVNQQGQNKNGMPQGENHQGNENNNNPAQQARKGEESGTGRASGPAVSLIPYYRAKPALPEPALTAILPKEEKQPETPAEDISGLLLLAEVAEMHGKMQPANHNGATVPFSGQRGRGNETYNPADNATKQVLPSFSRPRNAEQRRARNTKSLPPVNQVINDMVDQSFQALSDEQKARVKRGWEAQEQERLAEENADRQSMEGQQVNGQPIRQNTVGEASIGQVTRASGTARTVGIERLKNRGHKNGFVSFGEYVQADMPSPSLSHFSISAKRPRITYNQNTEPYPSVQQHEPAPPFYIFQAILGRPELVIMLAKHLRVQELLILYSICRPFHNVVKLRLTTVVVAQAVARAAESARIFPFRCYRSLCVEDPAERPHPVPEKAAAGQVRKVPSFRWLRMVCYREMVCHEIMTIMAEDGVSMPDGCESAMKKIWFLMDVPDNQRRIGMVQNREIFTDSDLFFATQFFVKMDMRFTDPLTGSGKDGMRRLLMAQPGLTMLWRTLKRTALVSKLDVTKLFIRWKWQVRPTQSSRAVLGIPRNEVGIMQYEAWGRYGSRVVLQRPDELILLETIRRELRLDAKYTDMFLWGYINPNTMENFPPIERAREMDRMEGWEVDLVPRQDKGKMVAPKRVSTRVIQNRRRA